MMKRNLISVSVAVVAAVAAFGDVSFNGALVTKGNYAGQLFTLRMITSWGGTTSGFGVESCALTNASNWSDGLAPSSDKAYLIEGTDGRIATVDGDVVFGGKSLTLGEIGGNAGYLAPSKVSSFDIGGDGLVINNGGVVWQDFTYGTPGFSGKVTVNAPASAPADFFNRWAQYAAHTVHFTELSGDASAGLRFRSSGTEAGTLTVSFSGDWTGYHGVFTVTNFCSTRFTDVFCPGSLRLFTTGAKASLSTGGDKCSGTIRFGSIGMKSSIPVTLGMNSSTNSTLSTDSLTVDGEGKVPLSLLLNGLPEPREWPYDLTSQPRTAVFVDLPAEAEPIVDTFDITPVYPSSYGEYAMMYTLYRTMVGADLREEVADGRRRFVLRVPKYTYCNVPGGDNDLLLDHPEYWEGVGEGEAFSADTAYYVVYDGDFRLTRNQDFVFPGGSLCLMRGCAMLGGTLTVDDLRVVPPVKFQYRSSHGNTNTVNGNITIYEKSASGVSGSVQFWSGENLTMTVNSKFHGSGEIVISNPSWEKTSHRNVVFTGDNSDYAGKITVKHIGDGYKTTLRITDGKNLGGALDAFTFDAVGLGSGAVLDVRTSTALTESTRGMCAMDGSEIKVLNEGEVFRVASTFSCTGTVTKTGNGILALAETAVVGTGTPELVVSGGGLLAAGTSAVTGLSVRFASGTFLRFDADTSDEGLKASGLDLTGSVFTSADGVLDVVCRTESSVKAKDGETIALFTGTEEAMADLAGRIKVRLVDSRGVSGRAKVKVLDSVEGDGKTVFATFGNYGTVMTVR